MAEAEATEAAAISVELSNTPSIMEETPAMLLCTPTSQVGSARTTNRLQTNRSMSNVRYISIIRPT
jgi:hypothetical protein